MARHRQPLSRNRSTSPDAERPSRQARRAQGRAAPSADPEKRQLTVLSCGLVGSTALAVNLDPEDFGDIIRRFQEICTSVITHWGGAIVNFVGEETLAAFGYIKGNEDDAEGAVNADLDLVARS